MILEAFILAQLRTNFENFKAILRNVGHSYKAVFTDLQHAVSINLRCRAVRSLSMLVKYYLNGDEISKVAYFQLSSFIMLRYPYYLLIVINLVNKNVYRNFSRERNLTRSIKRLHGSSPGKSNFYFDKFALSAKCKSFYSRTYVFECHHSTGY